ncbi:unnamed protein product [Urochloa humidicola]
MDPIKVLRDSMDARIMEERQEMDRQFQLHRANMNKMILVERENLDMMIKHERASMDTKLKEEREEMDRIIEMQHINMEAENMQLRMEMEAKLAKGVGIDLKLPLHQMEVKTEQLPMDIPLPAHVEVTNEPSLAHEEVTNESQKHVVMEFRVHAGGEFSFNPRGYHGGWKGAMTFVGPAEVEWWRMVEHLACHGYKGNAQLYYKHPAREAPEGLVFMSGPEQVKDLLHDHLGTKVCDLYIVNHERDFDVTVRMMMVLHEESVDCIFIKLRDCWDKLCLVFSTFQLLSLG